jgi:fucose permease
MNRDARLLLLAYLAFISLGLPDTIFGIAWPSLRQQFALPPEAMGAALVAGVSGYFCSGLLAGGLMRRLGVGGLLSLSSGLVALGLAGYALAPAWSLFFPVAFFIGLGSGAIDAALNAYAARHFSVRHMNWLHASWGVGASAGPMIMTAAVAGPGYRSGYALLSLLLGLMASAFIATRRQWSQPEGAAPAPSERSGTLKDALRSRSVWLSMAVFFCYTGLESTVGQWCFTWLTEGRGLGVAEAGVWTASYWASLTLGRVALGWVAEWWGPDRLLRRASAGVVAGVVLLVVAPGLSGRLGVSLAPVYPTLMARTPRRVGQGLAAHAVGLLVSAATLGSALLPALVGFLVGRQGLEAISATSLALGVAFALLHEVCVALPDAATSPEPDARPPAG